MMPTTELLANYGLGAISRITLAAMILTLTILTAAPAHAQTFSVIHYFTGGAAGEFPFAGLTVGPLGVLYGTTSGSGTSNYGSAFKLSQVDSSWVLTPLYEFNGSDGAGPDSSMVIGPNDALYGTTPRDTESNGIVYELSPLARFVGRSCAIGTKLYFTALWQVWMGKSRPEI